MLVLAICMCRGSTGIEMIGFRKGRAGQEGRKSVAFGGGFSFA